MADDDDLFSLDFTVPGAFSPKPEPPRAPEPVATPEPKLPPMTLSLVPMDGEPEAFVAPPPVPPPPIAVVKPAPVIAPPRRPPLPPALREAAEMYAAGQELEAMRRLESAIKSKEALGDATLRVWRALFDVLQVLGRRSAFESLALVFAQRFEKSPPAWSSEVAASTHTMDSTSGGRAYISLTGALDAGVGEVLKQALKLTQTKPMLRIDLNKLDSVTNDGATLLMRAIAALKKAQKEFTFGHPEHLIEILDKRLVVGEPKNEAMWMLLLEMHKSAYRQAAFEDAAVNYAITFEVSPPSWEPLPSKPRPPLAPKNTPAKPAGFSLKGQMIGATPSEFAALQHIAAQRDEVEIDAFDLVRIDTISAKGLADVLKTLIAQGKKIRIVGLPTLVAVYLETLGFADAIELRSRTI